MGFTFSVGREEQGVFKKNKSVQCIKPSDTKISAPGPRPFSPQKPAGMRVHSVVKLLPGEPGSFSFLPPERGMLGVRRGGAGGEGGGEALAFSFCAPFILSPPPSPSSFLVALAGGVEGEVRCWVCLCSSEVGGESHAPGRDRGSLFQPEKGGRARASPALLWLLSKCRTVLALCVASPTAEWGLAARNMEGNLLIYGGERWGGFSPPSG